MTHPLTLPGRVRYLPSYSMMYGMDYTPPSWFKQRAIDLVILSCVGFPIWRRHHMREKPIYKFLDTRTGQVIYYDNLQDYKDAIYNRLPELKPDARPGFFNQYEFDFRNRAYSSYLAWEPFWMRTRNWLTFNNWRSSRNHFQHRLKDNHWAHNTDQDAPDDDESFADNYDDYVFGIGYRNPSSDRVRYGMDHDYSDKLDETPPHESSPGTFMHNDVNAAYHPPSEVFEPGYWEDVQIRVIGDYGLDNDYHGPRLLAKVEGGENGFLDANMSDEMIASLHPMHFGRPSPSLTLEHNVNSLKF